MSRIGKKPILIPQGVEIKIEGQKVTVKGPKGELSREVRPEIKVVQEDSQLVISPQKETKETAAFWGLTRALLANDIKGVTEGFVKRLEIEGVGYRAALEGQDLNLQMGFSHPVKIKAPEGITFSVEKNVIIVSGIDKGLVGQTSARIRAVKPPEPYKGKGIRYEGEQVRRKLGKKAVATAG
ncbi:MAG: 50S ribosomal protein L6 [Candidatus Paceibacterota bacterium]|jgi:large subunit ribosomal protein L6|nr:50S ribosomal protein L6 [Candidatus Paceibacterota bacterium]